MNEVKTVVGVSPFYGRTLNREGARGDQIIVRAAEVDQFFPQVPISAKNYAATSVPVRMVTTEQFRRTSGYNEEFADVFRLMRQLRIIPDVGDPAGTIDDISDIIAEFLFQLIQGGDFFLERPMEQTGDNSVEIEFHGGKA